MRKTLVAALLLATALAASAQAAETEIDQENSKFVPDTVSIKTGDTLVFKNGDAFTHNMTVVNPQGEKTDIGMQKPGGDVVRYAFRDAGEYLVRCSLHPMMKLAVTVK